MLHNFMHEGFTINFCFVSGKRFIRITEDHLVSLIKAISEVNIMSDSPFSDVAILI
jgi:hypothetical protein